MKSFEHIISNSGRSKKRLSVFVALSMVLLLCFTTACSQKPTEASSSSASASVSSMSSSVSSEPPVSSQAEEAESSSSSRELLPGEENYVPEPVVPIETNYITVYFPEELTKDITLAHLEEDGHQTIAFSSTIGGKDLLLFTVVFAPPGTEDFQLGVLKDETAGEVPVCIRMNVQNETDWTAEEFERINRLQERVNDLIIQFYEDPRFVPNQ